VGPRRSRFLKLLLAFTLTAGALAASSGLWLPMLGRALVYDDGPAAADIAVVLAGDYTGHRITGGAEMARRGYVPAVLVSGPPGLYGINEADAAIHYIVAQGYPAACFIPLRHAAMSTRDEARIILDELGRRHVHTFLLVTSNFHTRRARRIFLDSERRLGGGPQMRVIATSDQDYDPQAWWRTRQGRKVAFLEWTKTVTGMLGI
jgi:uncharacterized SAM-binding protein YcdF (DUF218 family)